jgi:hypothetical protein
VGVVSWEWFAALDTQPADRRGRALATVSPEVCPS